MRLHFLDWVPSLTDYIVGKLRVYSADCSDLPLFTTPKHVPKGQKRQHAIKWARDHAANNGYDYLLGFIEAIIEVDGTTRGDDWEEPR